MSEVVFINPTLNSNKATKRYEFDIQNIDLSIVNGIRRTILTDIPNIGFMGEETGNIEPSITIHKNNGPLHNEFMKHRIGLIPIFFTEEEVETFNEGDYEFSCDIKNTTKDMMNITTHHLKGKHQGVNIEEKELKRLFPVNEITKEPVLITRLRNNEELSFTAKVIKATSKIHSSFSPVSLCSFFFNVDEAKAKETNSILDKERSYQKNEFGDPTSIHFMIETECNLSYTYIISKAFEILIDKIEEIHREVDVSNSSKIKIIKNTEIKNTFDLQIVNEDDTIGNLFQSLIYNRFIRNDNKVYGDKYNISYVGYVAPHPLDPKVNIRMTLKNDNVTPDEKEYVIVLKECCRLIEAELREVYNTWTRFN